MAPELLTVIVASVSCVAFCVVILILVVVFYRKHPPCCRPEHYRSDPPHYHGNISQIGITYNEHGVAINNGATRPQFPARLFIIGKPNEYHMNGPLPHLPSYESVCEKDRQRKIQGIITQGFGLRGCQEEPPPTYEETLCQTLSTAPVDLRLSVHQSELTHSDSTNHLCDNAHNHCQPSTVLQGLAASSCTAQTSSFLSF
ncbi:hypothetical protein EXN66_Car020468 [Channa argus]|uniref:Uncharacterized protein n=1 Tax=Channa argus TaxID=215402 RepID=A0A6G1QRD0_CHAAH|nr:hypothetical protein EXN66_Car020468 [Channa argus]